MTHGYQDVCNNKLIDMIHQYSSLEEHDQEWLQLYTMTLTKFLAQHGSIPEDMVSFILSC